MRRTKETKDLLVSLKFYIFNNNDWYLETVRKVENLARVGNAGGNTATC